MALKTIVLERSNPQLVCGGSNADVNDLIDITLNVNKFPSATSPIESRLVSIGAGGVDFDFTYELEYESNDLPSGILEIDPCDVTMIQCGGLCSPITSGQVCSEQGSISSQECEPIKPPCPALNSLDLCDQDLVKCTIPDLPCSPSYEELVEHVRALQDIVKALCDIKSHAFLQKFEVRLRSVTTKACSNSQLIEALEQEIIKLKNQ